MIRRIFDTYGAPLLIGFFIAFYLVENKFQLRKRVGSRRTRTVVNFLVALPAFALLRVLFLPAVVWLAIRNQSWHAGLTYWLKAPAAIKAISCFLLLDYGNYAWHILLHRLPILWRFHLVHHTDVDLDVSTALRFHFGEMIASLFFRGAAVVLTGASPITVLVYEIAFEGATQFHHSNTKLPLRFERALNYLVVTPRMHGIHHSQVKSQTDSNYSVIFSFWDRIHKTARLNVHQSEITIGVPSYADGQELTIGMLLKLPFKRIRDWK